MENKKLIKILRKDMSELEELISDVKSQGSFNALEMDFIHTRAKGLMQIIQLLKVDEEGSNGKIPVENDKLEELKETVSDFQEKVEEKIEESIEPIVEDVKKGKSKEVTKEFSENNESIIIEQKKEFEKEVAETDEEKESIENEPNNSESELNITGEPEQVDEEMLEEESEKPEGNSTIGDSFLKGKSINDLLTGQNNLEFKLSNRPVSSIKTAIGINDRFQYIRELFEGNAEKFAKTVDDLDSKENVKQAVEYLRENYKWKKSETSLKFVNLVKRRFQNE
jgi:hypothetical protein